MNYQKLILIENLFQAWDEFLKGKRNKKDVQIFERNLEDNLFALHEDLENKTYRHGNYQAFYVQDPKQRHIHKAPIRDRIVHHLLYKYLYEIFDKSFIDDSFSCRLNKGTHGAVSRLEKFTRIVSKNYTKYCWALKLDIKKFFAGVDHRVLFNILKMRIKDQNILCLIKEIIDSFHSELGLNKGIPLGNLTSQIFANIYLNELDQFVKHKLKVKYYLRYCDDFMLLSQDRNYLYHCTSTLKQFLIERLGLELHPQKISLRKLNCGIDFLGYVVFPYYKIPRAKTKRRIFTKILKPQISYQTLQSYLGYLCHANSYKISQEIKNLFWLVRCGGKF